MFLRVDKLQVEWPAPLRADPNAAAALHELLGARYGEMSTLDRHQALRGVAVVGRRCLPAVRRPCGGRGVTAGARAGAAGRIGNLRGPSRSQARFSWSATQATFWSRSVSLSGTPWSFQPIIR